MSYFPHNMFQAFKNRVYTNVNMYNAARSYKPGFLSYQKEIDCFHLCAYSGTLSLPKMPLPTTANPSHPSVTDSPRRNSLLPSERLITVFSISIVYLMLPVPVLSTLCSVTLVPSKQREQPV